MNCRRYLFSAACLALVAAVPPPAQAQFDLLRKLTPVSTAGAQDGPQSKYVQAQGAIARRVGDGDLAGASLLADALVADEQASRPGSAWLRHAAAQAASLYERSGNLARALELYQLALATPGQGRGMPLALADFPIRVKIAGLQLKTGDAAGAGQAYQALLVAPEGAAPMLRAQRPEIYLGLARVAAERGDDAKAEAMFLQAIGDEVVQARMGKESGLEGVMAVFGGARGRIDEALASLAARQALTDSNGALIAPGPRSGLLDVDGPMLELAALYFRQRNAVALEGLYLGKFSDQAARAAGQDNPFGAPVQLEQRHARFGAWFAGLGQYRLAGQALNQALSLNARRLAASAADLPPELLAGGLRRAARSSTC